MHMHLYSKWWCVELNKIPLAILIEEKWDDTFIIPDPKERFCTKPGKVSKLRSL